MTAPGQQRPRPPKRRDRDADGWQLIGYYVARDGVVTVRDAQIALDNGWKDHHGLGDARRVRDIRAHVTQKSKQELRQGLQPGDPKAKFRGWVFSYRDIEGSPSVLHEVDGTMYDAARGLYSLLGITTRLKQGSTERERMAHECRKAAEEFMRKNRTDISIAFLDVARDFETFGLPQDVHMEALRVLLESWL